MTWYLATPLLALAACTVDYDLIDRAPGDPPGPPTLEDGFTQLEGLEALDVLVVVDASGSMQDDLERVGQGMLQLQQDIDRVAHWWSFTFISADAAQPGEVGPYTSDDTTGLDLLVAPYLLPMAGGERGFGAAHTWVSRYPERLRPGADLLIFLISDEDEQSSLTPAVFHDWLLSLETDDRRTDVVSIVSTGVACTDDVGFKYMGLANLRGSEAVNLCEDWTGWLSEASFLTERIDHLVLSEPPAEETLEVTIDGVATEAWWYEPDGHTVWFEDVPEAGAEVRVRYQAG